MICVPIVRGKYCGNVCYDPVTLTLIAVAAMAGSTAYSAHEERKAAEDATEAQLQISKDQIQATKDQEILAQDTATKKTKLAQAKQSKTILSAPNTLDEVDTNAQSAIGV